MEVRIVGERYFGVHGTIVEMVRDPVVMETESKVPVALVKLEDGQVVYVPRTNLEVVSPLPYGLVSGSF